MSTCSRGVGERVNKDLKNSLNTCGLFDLIGAESSDSIWTKWSFTDWLTHFIVFLNFCYNELAELWISKISIFCSRWDMIFARKMTSRETFFWC